MISLTAHAFNELFNQVEEATHVRFFVQDNEIVMYAEDECSSSEIEEARQEGKAVGDLDGVLAVIPYQEEATQKVSHHDVHAALCGTVRNLMQQIEQMRGLFDDEDGTIRAALEDGEAALSLAQAQAETPLMVVEVYEGLVQNVYSTIPSNYICVDGDIEGADPDDLKKTLDFGEGFVSGVDKCRTNPALVERTRLVAEN